jgi:hypothetical protein
MRHLLSECRFFWIWLEVIELVGHGAGHIERELFRSLPVRIGDPEVEMGLPGLSKVRRSMRGACCEAKGTLFSIPLLRYAF